jgi:unconventional prefoldin RPB5 interactor 1
MAAIRDSFVDLERHRQRLEEAVRKHKDNLQHWQKWLLDYASLKEEVDALPSPASKRELARARDDFEGDVIDDKELREIFGTAQLRSAEQVSGLLSRRIDYVEQSLASLEKQLEAAQNKLAAATVVAAPDARNEDGLPFTDIVEELDEDGNVVSVRLQRPDDSAPQVLEALQKAGVEDLPALASVKQTSGTSAEAGPQQKDNPSISAPVAKTVSKARKAAAASEQVSETKPVKKGVSFAEDVKPGHEAENPPSKSIVAQRLDRIMEEARQQEANSKTASNMPVAHGDSAEDADLRREMLEYGRSEIGPIVAELELEEGDSDDDDELSQSECTATDDEDEYGMSFGGIDETYRRRMKELETKLGVKSSYEIEQAEIAGFTKQAEGVGRIAIVEPKSAASHTAVGLALGDDSGERIEPLSNVIERTSSEMPRAKQPSKKASRFKSALAERAAPQEESISTTGTNGTNGTKGPHQAPARFLDLEERDVAPMGPEGHTIADTVVERTTSSAKAPDELDASLLQQEVAAEYHQRRNKEIQSQGGFLKENAPKVASMSVAEEEEPPRRVSRFKAARLSRQ